MFTRVDSGQLTKFMDKLDRLVSRNKIAIAKAELIFLAELWRLFTLAFYKNFRFESVNLNLV